jgi:hypothetical protein
LVYADVIVLGGSVHSRKKNTGAVVVASKETGLKADADNIKYMVISRDQNAGLSQNIKTDNNSLERMEEFTTLINQTSIQEEIKSRFCSLIIMLCCWKK